MGKRASQVCSCARAPRPTGQMRRDFFIYLRRVYNNVPWLWQKWIWVGETFRRRAAALVFVLLSSSSCLFFSFFFVLLFFPSRQFFVYFRALRSWPQPRCIWCVPVNEQSNMQMRAAPTTRLLFAARRQIDNDSTRSATALTNMIRGERVSPYKRY